MGAVSPTPALDVAAAARAVREVLEPAARGLQAEGRPFYGLLYAGLMVTPSGPKVLEFNCRFGDPEAQPLLLRLDEDLAPLLHQIARGRAPERVRFRERSAACVVLVSAGYPGEYSSGQPISGLEQAAELPEVVIFHAGTRRAGHEELVTAGGRVLGVTALGDSLEAARARAYQAVECIHFPGAHYRRDIGKRGSA